ncbi:hypothetical protein C2857_001983 [Epichloe festucae Fl1]|uniref:NWD NACHT-NTPase N-terminal domain-containing protein n=1 Tax=Epichloe festucae (strain Fl1) TaxID=877507 RepID=A0A7U3Q046_EPIFF|nr:hypothetical protein C2857_001983 [Epichloe festucae Fl1]
MMEAEDNNNHTTGTRTIRKFVGRLRGNSVGAPTTPPRHDNIASSSSSSSSSLRTSSFPIGTPRASQSPDSQSTSSSSSTRNRRGRNGSQAKDAQSCLDLWNAAYDALQDDPSYSGLVVAYENIISQELPHYMKMGGLHSSFRGKPADERQGLLQEITAAGLEKRRASSTSQADDLAKKVLDSARDQTELVASEYNAAFIAWTGFCTLTPLQVPGSWEDHDKFRQNQSATRDMLVKLNGRVLEFEMNCVCATASAWNAGARNVVRWNTMDQLVDSIIKLEEQVIEIVEQNCTAKVRNTLLMQYRDMDIPSSSVEGS